MRLEHVFTEIFRASNGDMVECEGEYGGAGGSRAWYGGVSASRAWYNDDEDFGAGYDDVGEIGESDAR